MTAPPARRAAGRGQRDPGGDLEAASGAVRRAWLRRGDDPGDRGRAAGRPGAGPSLLRHQGGAVRRRDAAAGGAERGADRGAAAGAAAGADARGRGAGPARPGFGAHLVRTALRAVGVRRAEGDVPRAAQVGGHQRAGAVMLREFIADSILGTVARVAGLGRQGSPAEAEYRAAMVATQMLGLALTRLLRLGRRRGQRGRARRDRRPLGRAVPERRYPRHEPRGLARLPRPRLAGGKPSTDR